MADKIMVANAGDELTPLRLNGNFGTCFRGEIAAYDKKTAKYLLEGKFPQNDKRSGEPYAYPLSAAELEDIKSRKVQRSQYVAAA